MELELENGSIRFKPYFDNGEKRAEAIYEGEEYHEEDIKLSGNGISRLANTLDKANLEPRDDIQENLMSLKSKAQKELKEALNETKEMNQSLGEKTKVDPDYLSQFEKQDNITEGGITGKVNGTLYMTAWFRSEGKYTPVILTSDGEVHRIRNKLSEIEEKGMDLPQKQKKEFDYDYVRIGETKVILEEIPERPVNINYVDEGILNYLKSEQKDSSVIEDQLDITDEEGDIIKYELWSKIKYYLQSIFDHSNEKWYDFFAAHTVHTYLIQAIGYTFYPVLLGKPNTGKTQLQRGLAYTDYNGRFTGNTTPTAAVRLAHTYQVSMHQDEANKLSQEMKKQLIGLYNSGYDKEGSYTQTDMNAESISDQIREIRSFCPKTISLNNYGKDWAESFRSRGIVIQTEKTDRDNIIDTVRFTEQHKEDLQNLRNAIATYVLSNWIDILGDIENVEDNLDGYDRQTQKLALYQGINNHFGNPPGDMINLLQSSETSIRQLTKSEELVIDYIIADIDKGTEAIFYEYKELAEHLGDKIKNKDISSKAVKEILSSIGFYRAEKQEKRTSSGRKGLEIPIEMVVDALESMDLDKKLKRIEARNYQPKYDEVYEINFPVT